MEDFEIKVFETLREEIRIRDKHKDNLIKYLLITLIVAIIAIVSVHGMTLIYLYQYDYCTSNVVQDTDAGGNNNFISGDGDMHGTTNHKNSETTP